MVMGALARFKTQKQMVLYLPVHVSHSTGPRTVCRYMHTHTSPLPAGGTAECWAYANSVCHMLFKEQTIKFPTTPQYLALSDI